MCAHKAWNLRYDTIEMITATKGDYFRIKGDFSDGENG